MNCYSFYARDMITGTFDIEKPQLKKPLVISCSSDNECGEMISFLRGRISLISAQCTMTTLREVNFAS